MLQQSIETLQCTVAHSLTCVSSWYSENGTGTVLHTGDDGHVTVKRAHPAGQHPAHVSATTTMHAELGRSADTLMLAV